MLLQLNFASFKHICMVIYQGCPVCAKNH